MANLLHQLYKTKLRLAGVVTAVGGVGLLFVAKYVSGIPTLGWMAQWPISEVGAIVLSAGIFGIIFEYYTREESDARDNARFDAAIHRGAPAIRDAVLDSLAFKADALKDVASPETLDRIATNALGLRLGDEHLAHDVYTDHVRFDYQGADIRFVNALDYFASTEQARVEQAPATAPAKTVDIAFDGWIFPRSGVAFVWVLEDEMKTGGETA